MPSSRGSSWPRRQTQVYLSAGRLFTIWATREAWESTQEFKIWVIRSKKKYLPVWIISPVEGVFPSLEIPYFYIVVMSVFNLFFQGQE